MFSWCRFFSSFYIGKYFQIFSLCRFFSSCYIGKHFQIFSLCRFLSSFVQIDTFQICSWCRILSSFIQIEIYFCSSLLPYAFVRFPYLITDGFFFLSFSGSLSFGFLITLPFENMTCCSALVFSYQSMCSRRWVQVQIIEFIKLII